MNTTGLRLPTPTLTAWTLAVGLFALGDRAAQAQIVLDGAATQLTVEGYSNLSAGDADRFAGARGDDTRFDAGARVLGRLRFDDLPDIGLRLAAEADEERAQLVEASVLIFGGNGRLEIGERPGLPDVLTGYAPNNFQFTSAEFGPASGQSLDPGGRLQTAFLPSALAGQINPLAALGVTAALFDDRSTRILYVSPKQDGWLGGFSYADDADADAIGKLLQAGLTHESYWQQNVLRWGATYAHGRAISGSLSKLRDLSSVGAGISLTLDDSLTFGIGASYDGRSGLPSSVAGSFASAAWGATVSVNYNRGPWTIGGYYQYATAEGSPTLPRNDRLSALEAGASYRFTTKARVYGAWYRFDFADEDRSASGLTDAGNVFVLGVRVAL